MTDLDGTVRPLLNSTNDLLADLEQAGDDASRSIGARLQASVVGPLQQHAAGTAAAHDRADQDIPPRWEPDGPASSASAAQLDGRLWELARAATELRSQQLDVPGLGEAAAALQDLAVGLADEASAASRIAELTALQVEAVQQIQAVPDGPHLVTNPEHLYDHLGVPIPTRPLMALCRCGESSIKPTCNGTCHRIGFTSAKDPSRVADRRDSYVGQSVTVLDNRGTCQHSGLCTDRLASVFHLGQEPFVTPSGGRLDEIVRAVRDCPSGALSYAMDTVEAREQVDYAGQREPAIEVSQDGPYRITGGIPLVAADGGDVARNAGSSREHYALCRCGHSQNKPFCSGMHYYVNFTDPVPDPEATPSIFEWCGGLPALTRMTRLFYEKYVPADEMLAPIFANMSADHPQRVAKWLGEVFGGPACYSEEYGGYPRMIAEHVGRCLTEEWRARWVALMIQSSQEAGLPNDAEFRSAFSSYLEWGSRLAVENSQTTSRPPQHMPMPSWNWTTAAGAPGGRISALAPVEDDEAPVVLPAADEPVRFAKHIKPLFRARDRQSMTFVFDLWSYDDVRAHAEPILTRLSNGTMPCDGAWPAEKVDVFRRWMDTGSTA